MHYCLDLWGAEPFNFRITKKRNSKLGDYKYDPVLKQHFISVNHNLNKYSFLITYIHEVAHLLTTIRHGRYVTPHGHEWKSCFAELMEPVLTDLIFPKEILLPLKIHMKNAKASTYSDSRLVHALRKFDEHDNHLVLLSTLNNEDTFAFNKVLYQKLELRRTRVLCKQLGNGKKFLISKMALVEPYSAIQNLEQNNYNN